MHPAEPGDQLGLALTPELVERAVGIHEGLWTTSEASSLARTAWPSFATSASGPAEQVSPVAFRRREVVVGLVVHGSPPGR